MGRFALARGPRRRMNPGTASEKRPPSLPSSPPRRSGVARHPVGSRRFSCSQRLARAGPVAPGLAPGSHVAWETSTACHTGRTASSIRAGTLPQERVGSRLYSWCMCEMTEGLGSGVRLQTPSVKPLGRASAVASRANSAPHEWLIAPRRSAQRRCPRSRESAGPSQCQRSACGADSPRATRSVPRRARQATGRLRTLSPSDAASS